MKKYRVETKTKGVLYFDELPKNTYYLEGFQDIMDKGKACLFMFDDGTCLVPIIDNRTNKQVTK